MQIFFPCVDHGFFSERVQEAKWFCTEMLILSFKCSFCKLLLHLQQQSPLNFFLCVPKYIEVSSQNYAFSNLAHPVQKFSTFWNTECLLKEGENLLCSDMSHREKEFSFKNQKIDFVTFMVLKHKMGVSVDFAYGVRSREIASFQVRKRLLQLRYIRVAKASVFVGVCCGWSLTSGGTLVKAALCRHSFSLAVPLRVIPCAHSQEKSHLLGQKGQEFLSEL